MINTDGKADATFRLGVTFMYLACNIAKKIKTKIQHFVVTNRETLQGETHHLLGTHRSDVLIRSCGYLERNTEMSVSNSQRSGGLTPQR